MKCLDKKLLALKHWQEIRLSNQTTACERNASHFFVGWRRSNGFKTVVWAAFKCLHRNQFHNFEIAEFLLTRWNELHIVVLRWRKEKEISDWDIRWIPKKNHGRAIEWVETITKQKHFTFCCSGDNDFFFWFYITTNSWLLDANKSHKMPKSTKRFGVQKTECHQTEVIKKSHTEAAVLWGTIGTKLWQISSS